MRLKNSALFLILISILLNIADLNAQIVLLGENAPHANVNDGDFEAVKGYWRQSKQSPCWKTFNLEGLGEYKMGIHEGAMFSIHDLGAAESILLNTNPDYQSPKAGDVMKWSFGADLEYICKGTISLSIVFGGHERVVADKVTLIDAQEDVDLTSLRLGAPEELDYGRGCKVVKAKNKGKDLLLDFDGRHNGLTDGNFACKLLGKTKTGELIIGFAKLKAE